MFLSVKKGFRNKLVYQNTFSHVTNTQHNINALCFASNFCYDLTYFAGKSQIMKKRRRRKNGLIHLTLE